MTTPTTWAAARLRDLGYAAIACAWSAVGFAVLVAGASVTASTLVFVVGLPIWLGTARVVRATTWVDRRLAGWQRGESVAASYRRPASRGFRSALRTVNADPQTWRDVAWLALDSIVGFALGIVALTATGIALAWVSVPAWYWAIHDPSSKYGLTNLGMVVVDTPGKAAAVCGVGLALVPVALAVAGRCAAAHAALAVRVLAPRQLTRPTDRPSPTRTEYHAGARR